VTSSWFFLSTLNSYNLQHEEYQHELNTIHNILQNNSFPIKLHKPHILKPAKPKDPKTSKKWASFTYIGRETSYITNIFRQTDLNNSLRTKNTIGNLLTHKNPTPDIYSKYGKYKVSYPDCIKTYVGQTGRRFSTRYKEHNTAFRNNNQTHSFAKHLNEGHSFGTMNENMQILHRHQKKGPHLNTIERFHIHAKSITNNHLNDDQTIFPNAIFDALLNLLAPELFL